jgi:lantibiotic protection ABC transporter MutG family permease subunit
MTTLIRCMYSDLKKMKHTSMLWIHILLPLGAAGLFLFYYSMSTWKVDSKISGYLEFIGISYPLIIGLICSKAMEQEGQAGNFQNMLCCIKSRAAMYTSKLIVMLLLGAVSILLAVGVFAAGFKTAPVFLYGKAAEFLVVGNIFLYILHLFVSCQYGRGASIVLGIFESMISALALTGLGDGRWYYIPCTWSARLCDYLIYIWTNPKSADIGAAQINRCVFIAAPATIAAFVFSLLWFRNWEGRKNYE